MAQLALLGGPKVVTAPIPQWPQLSEADEAAIQAALEAARTSVWYLNSMPGLGPVTELEDRFAQHFGTRYALATSSGYGALQLALHGCGVEAGDEVIVSPYTWGQTVSPILSQMAIPIFADIDPRTYTLDPDAVEARITPYTKAILVVHIFGSVADLDPLLAIARRHGLKVIEDCAQATGARYNGRYVGTLGDVGCFSFGDGKQIIGGDGGMVLTDDASIYERAVAMGSHPLRQRRDIHDPELEPYIDSLTYTYRIHPLAAVVIKSQLDRLDQWNAERRRNHQQLSAVLTELPGLQPVYELPGTEHVYHRHSPTYVAEELDGLPRAAFVEAVAAEGVPANLGYVQTPIHLRPRLRDRRYFFGDGYPWKLHRGGRDVVYRAGDCPVAERRCAEQELDLLGMHAPALRGDQTALVEQIVDALQKVVEHRTELLDHARVAAG